MKKYSLIVNTEGLAAKPDIQQEEIKAWRHESFPHGEMISVPHTRLEGYPTLSKYNYFVVYALSRSPSYQDSFYIGMTQNMLGRLFDAFADIDMEKSKTRKSKIKIIQKLQNKDVNKQKPLYILQIARCTKYSVVQAIKKICRHDFRYYGITNKITKQQTLLNVLGRFDCTIGEVQENVVFKREFIAWMQEQINLYRRKREYLLEEVFKNIGVDNIS